jgi:polysaccharide export outer membrane protein
MKSLSERIVTVAMAAAAFLFFLQGCSSTETHTYGNFSPSSSKETPINANSSSLPPGESDLGLSVGRGVDPALEALWNARRSNTKDFAIGPGDVLQIQVPAVKELEDREVRVDGKGDIDLPLLGTMHVAGLSERELNSLLVSKLSDYVYNPEAEIFAKSYNNRQVAVTGEVRSPADYTLNGPLDTIRDLIQRAGGMTAQASPEIVLTPAEEGILPATAKANYSAASYNSSSAASNKNTLELNEDNPNLGQPLIIDLSRDSHQSRYLDLPVRPGDTIFVPAAGTVSMVGWVYKAQTIPITYKLSVLGAIAASGGTMWAADQHKVRIVRRQSDGQRAIMTVDIASIQAGKSGDVPLQDGDIIDVPYSAYKIPGYAIYYAVQGIVTYLPAYAITSGF